MKRDQSVFSQALVDVVDLAADVVILPVRHHSPACAWHVRCVIESLRPAAVLVEGPSDANHLIEPLLDPRTSPPVAVYCHGATGSTLAEVSFFYPLCLYSPEYVALQTGRSIGASLEFMDLPSYGLAQVMATEERQVNAYADGELRYHAYINELCRATGTRDFDELWADLFESNGPDLDSQTFFTQVATYCRIAREHCDPRRLQAEGNEAREAYMAQVIRAASQSCGRVVAVVGGLHRSALLNCLTATPSWSQPPASSKKDWAAYLTIYGYPQLDRWSGYQAGMPGPQFQHRGWESLVTNQGNENEKMLRDLARALQRRREAISTADLISAGAMLCGLMRLRGHARPTLDDLRDAATSAWLKATDDATRRAVCSAMDQWLIGTRVGQVSPTAGRPPLVDDFYGKLRMHKIIRHENELAAMRRKTVALDIYKHKTHRAKSAFFHQLAELDCDFARIASGPDFFHGRQTERVREAWVLRWRPEIESGLVEASIHGSSVAEAAANRLLDRSQDKESTHDSATAVGWLTSALLMNLPVLADEFLDRVRRAIATEPDFGCAAAAVRGLVHLVRYRRVLGAQRFPRIAALVGEAFRRAVWLVDTLPGLSAGVASHAGSRAGTLAVNLAPSHMKSHSQHAAVRGLLLLRQAAMTRHLEGVDSSIFLDALESVRSRLGRLPTLEGAVVGLLRQFDRLDSLGLAVTVRAAVDNTVAGAGATLGNFLTGLFAVRRHAITEEPTLLRAIHDCLTELSEERFLETLPSLRLAFTTFTPREVQRLVSRIHESVSPTAAARPALMGDLSVAPVVEERVAAALARLGLQEDSESHSPIAPSTAE